MYVEITGRQTGKTTRLIDSIIDFLKQNSSSNNNLVIDENNLPFKQESVSGVFSCLYVDSIIDSENLFTNIYKILKKDGFLIFSIFTREPLSFNFLIISFLASNLSKP